MFEFLSSPFGLVAVGLGVLAVAVLALCLWITTLDRRMRGMADGLEAERRKVAEMQMVIGRRNNAARSYGSRPARAPQPAAGGVPVAAAPMPRQAPAAQGQGRPMPPMGAPAPAASARPAAAAPRTAAPAARGGAAPAGSRAPQGVSRRRGGGWAPDEPVVASEQMAEAWVQSGGFGQQPIVMPEKKMSRKARREAERAFAARAAAELEARQARRAAEAGAAPARSVPQQGIRPYGGPAAPTRGTHAPAPMPGARPVPRGGSGFPDQYGVAAGGAAPVGRGRHAR